MRAFAAASTTRRAPDDATCAEGVAALAQACTSSNAASAVRIDGAIVSLIWIGKAVVSSGGISRVRGVHATSRASLEFHTLEEPAKPGIRTHFVEAGIDLGVDDGRVAVVRGALEPDERGVEAAAAEVDQREGAARNGRTCCARARIREHGVGRAVAAHAAQDPAEVALLGEAGYGGDALYRRERAGQVTRAPIGSCEVATGLRKPGVQLQHLFEL